MEIDNSNIEECIICYNEYHINDGIIFNCKHTMCITCYQSILNNTSNLTCPICRRSLEIIELDNQNTQQNTQQDTQQDTTSFNIYNCCKCVSAMSVCLSLVLLINIILNIMHQF